MLSLRLKPDFTQFPAGGECVLEPNRGDDVVQNEDGDKAVND